MKKNITILIAVITLLTACWGIEQALHKENSQEVEEVAATGLINTVVFEGNVETFDNPWNITAGIIEMEDEGETIFLTPNTSVLFQDIDGLDVVNFSYMIHPWVKDESDGAGIILSLVGSEDDILFQEKIEINAVDNWKEFKIDISRYEDITAIKLDCNNGKNDDASCDWVVLSLSEMQLMEAVTEGAPTEIGNCYWLLLTIAALAVSLMLLWTICRRIPLYRFFTGYKRKDIIINSLFSIILSIFFVFLILNRGLFQYWTSNGTGIVDIGDSQYQFTPFLETTDDIICQTIQPTKDGLRSIEVRLANEHSDEVDCILTFSLYDAVDNSLVFGESVDSADIENWRYYELTFSYPLIERHTYFLTIQCLENSASIPFKVFLCNVNLKENKVLTYNDNILEGELDLIYNYYTFPTINFMFVVALYLFFFLVIWINKDFFQRKIFSYSILFISIFLSFIIVEYLSGNSILDNMNFIAIITNLLIYAGICFLMFSLSGSSAIASFIIVFIATTLAIINHYILQFRGTIILPSDLYSISTAYNVAENYNIDLDYYVFQVIIYLPILFILFSKNKYKPDIKSRIIAGASSFIMLTLVILISFNDTVSTNLNLKIRQDAQNDRSHEIGFALNLTSNIKYTFLVKPSGYSDAEVERIYSLVETEEPIADSDIIQPNIIVIMNESFTDLAFLGQLETNSEYMENFYRIAQDENSKIGKCVVSVFGGGTSCSEFEFLTGCSMLFLQSGNAPYQQYINSAIDAVPSYLYENGFRTFAVHAANPRSWNRHVAYPLIGFETFLSTDDSVFDEATYCRYWIDDKSMMNELTSLYTDISQPLFIFGLTIQCHGGYTYENYESTIDIENMSEDYPDAEQFLSLIKDTDDAFGKFIDELKNSQEPTIVLMYGDHLPQLSSSFYSELKKSDSQISEAQAWLRDYETPYIFWANYDADFSDIPDVISANLLSPYLLKSAGVELDSYYQYLYALSQEYPVISRSGIMDIDGNIHSYEKGSDCYETIHAYEIIQYSRLTQ